MKLIKRTYLYTALWLPVVLVIGSVFIFYMIRYINYEETDEFLTYEMDRLVEYHRQHNDLPDFHQVAAILPGVKYDAPVFKDTFLLEPADNEMIPYRELYFSIEHNGTPQTIVLRHLMPGNDDIAEGTLMIIGGLMLLITLLIYVILNRTAGKIWKPFYQTLEKLTAFKISGPLPQLPSTEIDEFRLLNTTLDNLLKKAAADYRHNKEFGENASHELQTHLAIIRANTEKLINENRDSEIPGELEKIYSAVTALSQIQKSLLLLGKIGNQEFSNLVKTDLKTTVEQSLETFREAIEIREIKVTSVLDDCVVTTDPGLAGILVNNLLKNAVKYNVQGGFIQIGLNKNELEISNSGQPFAGSSENMMKRFEKGKDGNIGIGLAIVKQICGLYNFGVSYTVSDEAVHTVKVVFNS